MHERQIMVLFKINVYLFICFYDDELDNSYSIILNFLLQGCFDRFGEEGVLYPGYCSSTRLLDLEIKYF